MRPRFVSLIGVGFLGLVLSAPAQFLPEEITERPRWEEFLETAKVMASVQFTLEQAVTEPWKLTLSEGGITHFYDGAMQAIFLAWFLLHSSLPSVL